MLSSLVALSLLASKPSFDVQIVGDGPPVILIPGLACGPQGVWDATIAHLKDHHKCYVLTLPGFGGQPKVKAPILSKVRDDIEAYVTSMHLVRPVLIGHSLGGMMSLWLASDKPKMFGGVLAVDGVPYIAALYNPVATPPMMHTYADQIRAQYAKMTPEKFAASNHSSLAGLMTNPKDVAAVAKQSDLSDPPSVGEAVAEMLEIDLRPDMKQIACPVVLIMSGAQYPVPASLKAAQGRYEDEIKAIPTHKLVVAERARHFIMLDAPQFYFSELDAFLKRVRS